jgi:hypothetical protein
MDKNQPVGFMSYVRSDDSHENGRLSAFCARLSGEAWRKRLNDALGAVTLLIPIITPSFF